MHNKTKLSKQQILVEEQKKLFKNRKVVQLNKFIKGDVSAFSVNDLKIFKLIISKVDSKETLFKEFYEIYTDEIKALNINEKHLYSETKKTLKRLANIYITFDEGDTLREVGLIRNDFRFDKYSKRILINFNDDMGDYLINLKKNFFMYDLIDIVNFKFKHTLKFYEYIKSQSLNVIKLKIETIKEILDLKNKYNRFTNFKNDVLEVILEEINETSNTLYISYSEEKRGPKVEYIVFHIKRIKNDLLLEYSENNIENRYSNLLGKECEYLNKYHILENVDIDNNLIVLKELHTNTLTNIIKDDANGLESILKVLFGKEFKKHIDNYEEDEIKRLKNAKDFRKFKDEVIKQYKGKKLVNNIPGFDLEDIISVEEETGYLKNSTIGKILSKEESYEIWRYLYKNKDLVGKIIKNDPTKVFINNVINVQKTNDKGEKELIKYIVSNILEEIENGETKYRLFLKDALNPFIDEEKSKTLLTIEQLRIFINTNKIEE